MSYENPPPEGYQSLAKCLADSYSGPLPIEFDPPSPPRLVVDEDYQYFQRATPEEEWQPERPLSREQWRFDSLRK